MKTWIWATIAVLCVVLSFGAGLMIFAMNREADNAAFTFLNRVADKITRTISAVTEDPEAARTEYFPSIHLGLEGRVVTVPRASRPGAAGGITNVGDEVVLTTFEGKIYTARADGTLTETRITTPDHGIDAYIAASKRPPYDSMNHSIGRLRYNGIAHYDGPHGSALLLSYIKYHDAEECVTSVVSELPLPNGTPASQLEAGPKDWSVLYETAPCLPMKAGPHLAIQGDESGGRIAFSPDGEKTYFSVGDFGWNGWDAIVDHPLAPTPVAQNDAADYGKIIEIDMATREARHISKGHRNPQGIAVDPAGNIWEVEHGPRGGDELNLIEDGNNYGWPFETYGTDYNGAPIPVATSYAQHDRFTKPVFTWLPSVATCALTVVRGFHPAWDGDLLATTLNGRMLIRIRIDGKRAVFAERIPVGNRRIRDVHQLPDDTIVLWTDSHELIFLSPLEGGEGEQFIDRHLAAMDLPEDTRTAIAAALDHCSDCHSFSRGENRIGPSLTNVFDEPVGRADPFEYSEAMASASGEWTAERLKAFLRDPEAEIPGTAMPDPEIEDEAVLDGVVEILKVLHEQEW
ncbi:PQQ-dependent sugar dehydrogenase [Pseudoruegeria sp. HB172150]|uniref:PQQ-dependent sugar dehydrogenase n=1 Tax=Pseudoruegeria sp. HB172150 TaxID=2721164 RepID=UPI001553D10B|nr:PQQ-dependent sugar dehydrogenase [Pseudoruegeria sp. HB172150]